MKFKFLILTGALALAAVSQANFYNNSYTFNFTDQSANYQISNVYLLERSDDPANQFSYGFRLPGLQLNAPNGGTLSDYQDILTHPATDSLLICETNALPGDAAGQKHILLGMSSDAASYAAGISWGTLFGSTQEETIISSLESYVDPDPNVTQAALQNLVDFAYGPAETGILDNLAQPHSAWFTPGGGFSLMTWSDGNLVGSGTSSQIESVPEPVSCIALGLGGLALLRKRRR